MSGITGCENGCGGSVELTQGEQGLFGGFSGEWRKKSGITSTVATGGITFNNANVASATAIYVNKTNVDNIDLTNFITSLSNSSNYGLIRIFNEEDNSKFWYGTLTAVSGPVSNVYTLTVTTIQSSYSTGTFPTGVDLVLTFSPKGATGPSNSAGLVLLSNSVSNSATTLGAPPQILKSYTLPGGTLSVNNDIIEVEMVMDGAGDSTPSSYKPAIYFGTVGVNIGSVTKSLGTGGSLSISIVSKINRISQTSQRVTSTITLMKSTTNGTMIGGTVQPEGTYVVNNDVSLDLNNDQDIVARIDRGTGNLTAGQFTCRKLTVKHIKQ